MAIEHWKPRVKISRQEKYLLERCQKNRKLFVFLREHRHEIFDEEFEQELEAMYRDTGAGKDLLWPERCARGASPRASASMGTNATNGDLFTKDDFCLDLRSKTITCPAGHTEPIEFGKSVEFEPSVCAACEHRLAHIGQRQGPRARYVGIRKNLFDLRRAAAIQNLETTQRNAA
jgi:hypothetical protein